MSADLHPPTPSLPEPSFVRRILRVGGIVFLALGAFVLTGVVLDRVFPREQPQFVQERVAYLRAHGGQYNALFLGSSRMENNIMPEVFDRDVQAHGLSIESFNDGISGMYPPQDAYVLDRLLELKLPRIRWVFIELQTLQTTLPHANRDSQQQLYWHDWPRFRLLCERLVTTKEKHHWRDRVKEAWERWPDFCDHVRLFVRYFVGLGRGAAWLNRGAAEERTPAEQWTPDLALHRGWAPAGLEHVMSAGERAALDADLEVRREKPPVKEAGDVVTETALEQMIAKIQRAGATPVLIVPPTARGTYFTPDPKQVSGVVILNFCDPVKYPELYLAKYRVDPSHLNPAGAEIFSHLLAARFAETAQPPPGDLGAGLTEAPAR